MRAARKEKAAPSDAALMAALEGGDLSALGELYDRHVESVRRFTMRATGDAAAADDIAQDVFVALAGAAKRYDPGYPARSYILGIAGRLLMRRRRRSAIAARIFGELARMVRRVDQRTPEASASDDERLAQYRAALAQLSEAKRVTLLMADIEGMSGPEIAAALDIPVATVWTRLHHARAEVKKRVARRTS